MRIGAASPAAACVVKRLHGPHSNSEADAEVEVAIEVEVAAEAAAEVAAEVAVAAAAGPLRTR